MTHRGKTKQCLLFNCIIYPYGTLCRAQANKSSYWLSKWNLLFWVIIFHILQVRKLRLSEVQFSRSYSFWMTKTRVAFFPLIFILFGARERPVYCDSDVFLEGNCHYWIPFLAHFIFLGMCEEMSHSPKLIPCLLHMLSFIEVPHWLSTRCSTLSPYWRLWQNPRE